MAGPVGSLVLGASYTITFVGTTDFAAMGASGNTVGVTFKATSAGGGGGTGMVRYAGGKLADPTGKADSAPAINAALSVCPAGEFVYLPAGTYRINATLVFPKRGVVLRGAGSQTDPSTTNIQCHTGTAVSMQGSSSAFKGFLKGLKGGYEAGSTTLSFASASDLSGVSIGDVLVVIEDPDPGLGVVVSGRGEAIPFPSPSFAWASSGAVPGAFFMTSAGGGPPFLTSSRVQIMCSPGIGSEDIMTQASVPNAAGQWAYTDQDALGFASLYVILPGGLNPSSLPPPGTDGMPQGAVWCNPGLGYGGATNGPGGHYEVEGQGFKVLSKSGVTLTLDRPFYWSFTGNGIGVRDYALTSGEGLENMNLRVLQGSPASNTVSVSSLTDSWVRNVAVINSAENFISASATIDCEFDHNYVANPWNAQGGSGYGIRMLGWDFNNLIEDNIAYFCRHSYVQDGINCGNIFAYNFSLDPNDIANFPTTPLPVPGPNPPGNDGYLYQDFLTHGSNPRFALYEGNVGARGYCDFVHGSANNIVFFRNHFRLQEGAILQYDPLKGAETIDLDCWNDNMTVVGNILGYPAIQTAEGGAMTYENHVAAIFRLGYDADDNAQVVSDTRPKATLLRAWNYDYVNDGIVDGRPDMLPDSLFLSSAPAWFGTLAWPPVDPTNPIEAETEVPPGAPAGATPAIIPAMYRFLNGEPPPGAGNAG